jgi:hypothetical protein
MVGGQFIMEKTMNDLAQNAAWTKSNKCAHGNCVEVAAMDGGASVALRNSKNPGRILVFTMTEWYTFLDGVESGDFGG